MREASDDILCNAASVITSRPEEILDDWLYLFLML